MNKRWNSRKPVSLGLVINYPALGLLRGKAINISQDGMFIETVAISLSRYSEIELTLNLPELSDRPIQIPATIIHSSEKGIGIMFTDQGNMSKPSAGLATIHQLLNKPEHNYQHQRHAC